MIFYSLVISLLILTILVHKFIDPQLKAKPYLYSILWGIGFVMAYAVNRAMSIPIFFGLILVSFYFIPALKQFVIKYFKLFVLFLLFLARIIYFAIFGGTYCDFDWWRSTYYFAIQENRWQEIIDGFAGGPYWLEGFFSRLFYETGHLAYFLEIFVNLAFIFLVFWGLLELRKASLSLLFQFAYLAFFICSPDIHYVLELTGKDQIIALTSFSFIIYLFRVIRKNNISWIDVLMILLLGYLNYQAKQINSLIYIGVYFLIFLFIPQYKTIAKTIWIKFSIILGIPILCVVIGVTIGKTSNIGKILDNPPAWAFNVYANALNNPNFDWSSDELTQAKKYLEAQFDTTMTNEKHKVVGFQKLQSENISDDNGFYYFQPDPTISTWLLSNPNNQEQIARLGFSYSKSTQYFYDICFQNIRGCIKGFLQQEGNFLMPRILQETIVERPYPENAIWPWNNLRWYVNFQPPGDTLISRRKICDYENYFGSDFDDKITYEEFRDCVVASLTQLTEDEVDLFLSNMYPYFFKGGSLLPELYKENVSFWASLLFMNDLFWLLPLLFVLMIVILTFKSLRKYFPLTIGPFFIFLAYLWAAMISYGRYEFWALFDVVFIVFVLLAAYSQSKNKKPIPNSSDNKPNQNPDSEI